MVKSTELKQTVLKFVAENPALNRGTIARELQRAGVQYGKQHLNDTVTNMVNQGELSEVTDRTGRRLVYPAPAAGALAGAKV